MKQQIRDYLLSTYNIRRLGKKEIIKSFDCGDADLNDFILKESSLYRQALLAVTLSVGGSATKAEVVEIKSCKKGGTPQKRVTLRQNLNCV